MIVKKVVELNESELRAVASVHKRNYPSGHLTERFDTELLFDYYKIISELADSIVLAKDGDTIVGFAFLGNSFSGVMSKLILENKIKVIKFSFLNAVDVLKFIFSRVRSRSHGFKSASDVRLLSIVSDRSSGKKGVGYKLISYICNNLYQSKIVGLSVKIENINAINFYINNGFIVEGSIDGKMFMVEK
ncbi:hypothetical protein A136_13990 [Vibrio crassostreae 9ZC13]|uniref:hypothetical protein n=1 Tax=Vibrio crassostreae TaxID=246167 RepID=UPI00037759D6|nr:hypothetical protein [Vibrio crassostreae]OEF00505.1 hypothetical protein A136_13990 [Vibrio crassostreae 9ZC13]